MSGNGQWKLTARAIELLEEATIALQVLSVQHRLVTATVQTILTSAFGLRLALYL